MPTLDPDDWDEFRRMAHRMLDDALDDVASVEKGPVWRPMPAEVRGAWREGLPVDETDLASVYDAYQRLVVPYGTGNRHPGFFGWVHGAGSPVGMLAEMLAGGLNANLGGRDHAPIECERQVMQWAAEIVGFPTSADGILVTGTSIANFMAVLVARRAALGEGVRAAGVSDSPIVAYTSKGAHACIAKAFDMAGLGTDCLRRIGTTRTGALDLAELVDAVSADRAAGLLPMMVVATAGSVDMGAIDPLPEIAAICRVERMWFHVDGAFGVLGMLSPQMKPRFAGIELADSVAFDFHKWAHVPYDAGCLLVREGTALRATFETPVAYLSRSQRGLAAGAVWPCDIGPDLSRGFRALKVWMTFKTFGARRIGACIEQCCALARQLAGLVEREPLLELTAPAQLNIVCFRFAPGDDVMQAEIAAELQERGIAAPSTTIVGSQVVLRAAIINHRTRYEDVLRLVEATVRVGIELTAADDRRGLQDRLVSVSPER